MKRVSSVVWQFFDRIEENKRCVGVLCKLCERTYKYYGNTTNLRIHLAKKHPIQWELRQTNWEAKDISHDGDGEDATNLSTLSPTTPSRNVRYEIKIDKPNGSEEDYTPKIDIQRVDVLENKEDDDDDSHLVQQLHGSDEEWLEDDINNLLDGRHKTRVKQEFVSSPRRSFSYNRKTPKRQIVEAPSPTKDEYSLFGEYIANKLRKTKSMRTRGNIQQMITTILWQSEYGYFDSEESVRQMIAILPRTTSDTTVAKSRTVVDNSMEVVQETTETE